MSDCKHLAECEFVLRHVAKVKPHWDDFVSLYCCGEFQDVCQRRKEFGNYGSKPSHDLMPTGHLVPGIVKDE